jgi:hypothetical protein
MKPTDPPKKEADASTPATGKTAPVTANDANPAAAGKEIHRPGAGLGIPPLPPSFVFPRPATAPATPPAIEFFNPSALRGYVPPPGSILVGNNHIVRGAIFIIGGAPGVGKSRAGNGLAVAGATVKPWFGLTVHRQFRTLIVQNENGRHRLSEEFRGLPCEELDAWVRVSAPPPAGLAIRDLEFRKLLMEEIQQFDPDLVLIDPWNAVAPDDKAREFLETFAILRLLLQPGDAGPALGIIAHTRKPRHDERTSGRGLLNLLSGSHVLGSIPRCAFVLQAASDEPDDDRVVFTCCKNNDGDMGKPSAWQRRNGLFAAVEGFDWEEFHTPPASRVKITAEHVAEALDHGDRAVPRKDAVAALMKVAQCESAAAYRALEVGGRFKGRLREEGEARAQKIRWLTSQMSG